MLATSGPLPAEFSQAWVEPKIGGFRGVVFLTGREPLRVESRSGRNLAPALPELAELPGAVSVDAILDGELVTLDADGRPDFYALGPRLNCARPPSLESADANGVVLDGWRRRGMGGFAGTPAGGRSEHQHAER